MYACMNKMEVEKTDLKWLKPDMKSVTKVSCKHLWTSPLTRGHRPQAKVTLQLHVKELVKVHGIQDAQTQTCEDQTVSQEVCSQTEPTAVTS